MKINDKQKQRVVSDKQKEKDDKGFKRTENG